MGAPRYAQRRDKSEKLLVADLRARGATVHLMSVPCDALIGFRGFTVLGEFKTPDTAYGKKLNANQAEFQEVWHGSPIVVLRTHEDVENLCNSLVNHANNATKTNGSNGASKHPNEPNHIALKGGQI